MAQCCLYGSLMTHPRRWPTGLTAVTARQVRKYRDAAGLSAQQLADLMAAEIGTTYTRTQVTNLESGRRETITVGEILGFARILGVPPLLLLLPLGDAELVELMPGVTVDPWTAWRWTTGEAGVDALVRSSERDWSHPQYPDLVVDVYRRHDAALNGLLYAKALGEQAARDAAQRLAAARIQLNRNGWWLPPIPESAALAIREPMAAWGFVEESPGVIMALPPTADPSPFSADEQNGADK